VDSLERDVLAGAAPAAAAPEPQKVADAPPLAEPAAGPRKFDSPEAKPIDLLSTTGAPMAKRVGPIVGIIVVLLWLLRRRKKRRK
jgi:hypothetical protein